MVTDSKFKTAINFEFMFFCMKHLDIPGPAFETIIFDNVYFITKIIEKSNFCNQLANRKIKS